ncbi:Transmembrane protein 65 [Geodia barretti]|uniref:Transmembrane protein 65 n=1 Tax=Geodia barretti TaxID=519541 RepID=A0AA35QWE2_GEOBA|nr:Transmembrane protein 65 [Geodia barretti]
MASSFASGLRLWTPVGRRIIPQRCRALAQAPACCGNHHPFCSGPPLSFSIIIIRCTHSSVAVSNYRKQLATQEGANEFLSSLSGTQRSNLGSALVREEERENGKTEVVPPSWKQLRLLCYQNMLPFIGFGFLDNFIMITVADRIQETMGVMFLSHDNGGCRDGEHGVRSCRTGSC